MHETKVSIYLGTRRYLGEVILRMSSSAMGLPLSIDQRAKMGKKGTAMLDHHHGRAAGGAKRVMVLLQHHDKCATSNDKEVAATPHCHHDSTVSGAKKVAAMPKCALPEQCVKKLATGLL